MDAETEVFSTVELVSLNRGCHLLLNGDIVHPRSLAVPDRLNLRKTKYRFHQGSIKLSEMNLFCGVNWPLGLTSWRGYHLPHDIFPKTNFQTCWREIKYGLDFLSSFKRLIAGVTGGTLVRSAQPTCPLSTSYTFLFTYASCSEASRWQGVSKYASYQELRLAHHTAPQTRSFTAQLRPPKVFVDEWWWWPWHCLPIWWTLLWDRPEVDDLGTRLLFRKRGPGMHHDHQYRVSCQRAMLVLQ